MAQVYTEEQKARKRETAKKWAAAHPERCREAARKYYAAHPQTARVLTEEQKERKSARGKVWQEVNKEKIAAGKKAYYAANREEMTAQRRAHREANKEKYAVQQMARRLKSDYGLTPEGYAEMYEAQGGLCWICKEPKRSRLETGTSTREVLCIDHCHHTDKVRGLLCSKCNSAIGLFRENELNLLNAVVYLKHFTGLEAAALEQIEDVNGWGQIVGGARC